MIHHVLRLLGVFFICIAIAKMGYALYLYRKGKDNE